MGCCAFKHLTKWQGIVLLNAFLFVAASIFAMNVVTGDLKTNLKCIIDNARALLNPVDSNMAAGLEAASLIDQKVLDDIDKALDNIDLIAVAPGVICAVFLFVTVLTSCAGKKMGMCYPVSKFAVLVTWVFIILNLIFFGVIAVLGLAAQQDKAKTEWYDKTSTCSTSADSLQTQLTDASASLATAEAAAAASGGSEAAAAEVATAQADLAAAQVQLDQFTVMCACVTDTLSKLEPLAGPGVMGLIAALFALCTVNSLCCAMGCCTKRPPNKVSPEA